ncbi:MAG: thiamine pyrophosphate-dependent dehydrogenase E1 component subunit alpha [Gemmatimonas sp.]|nr:thiamine pyrophosphate-dependent dehydrogenase E1 component subunit alpha [Gemmatimonas sp.]
MGLGANNVDADARPGGSELLTSNDRVALLRYLLLMRAVEGKGLALYKQGKVPGSFYDGRGQEAISVGATFALGPGDPVCPLIRDMGAHLVKGTSVEAIFGQYLGRAEGVSGGREGNIHFGERRLGVLGMVSMLPDMMVVATGLAMGFKLRGEERCAVSFFGDGATSVGDWHEAMNWAGVYRLPVIFILENNGWAYSTPTNKQYAVPPLERARGYGVEARSVDGNDVEAVFEATHDARLAALRGDGPTLIECRTMRMHGHGAHDDMSYVPTELVEEWSSRDPIDRYSKRLRRDLELDVDSLRTEISETVAEAAEAALAMPMPDPEEATSGVFCEDQSGATLGLGEAPWSGFSASEVQQAAA